VGLTSFSYLEEAEIADIKILRYQPGFMHQKVILVDGSTAAIGTANFDNRSMRLNFEVTLLLADEEFAQEVKEMLEADFERSRRVSASEYRDRSLPFRFAVRVARLLAPVQ
jgi:cardiolipin synthase